MRDQEFRTAQQQVKKMTQARAWSEGSAIINEYEFDKTMPTKQFSQHQTRRNHSLYATRKEVDQKAENIRWKINESTNENELMHAIRNSQQGTKTRTRRRRPRNWPKLED